MKKILSEGEALERLLRIDWQSDLAFDRSNVTLMREYLRRMRRWYLKLEPATLPQEPSVQWWAFFDVAAAINPSVRAGKEIIDRWEKWLPQHARNVSEWYLHWTALENVIDLQAYELEAPYEPAIRVLERGCKFRWGGGEMEVGIGSFRISNPEFYNTAEPFVLLDDEPDSDDSY